MFPRQVPFGFKFFKRHKRGFKEKSSPDAAVLDSALAKVAKVDSEEKIDDEEEDEGCGNGGLSGLFGAKASVS